MTAASFHPTHWTLVIRAAGDTPEAKAALSDLCAAYYTPVVRFLWRERREEDEARELAHSFFACILEKGMGAPDGQRGRFRSYLLGALKNFLANQRVAENREKRGGKIEHVPLMAGTDTHPGMTIPAAPEANLDWAFDREWALTLISRALVALEQEHTPNPTLFAILKPWLDGRATEAQSLVAAKLGMSEGAVKVAIHRLRSRFREILRQEVLSTLHDEQDLADEMRHLVAIASQAI